MVGESRTPDANGGRHGGQVVGGSGGDPVRDATRTANEAPRRRGWSGLARDALLVTLFTLALTWTLRLVVDTAFGAQLDDRFWLRDFLGNLAVALVAFALIRKPVGTCLLATLVIGFFQLVNGAKLAVLGTPSSPDDFINVVNLYHLAEGWSRVALVAALAVPVLVLLWLVRWRRVTTWVTFAALALVSTLVASNPVPVRDALDARFGNSVWNQPENFRRRGLALHVVQESARTLAKVGRVPSAAEVALHFEGGPADGTAEKDGAAILAPLTATPADLAALDGRNGAAPRNVHVIVLESFFDPLSLGPEWVPDDPFPESFRSLWAETGNARTLSPVFGGYTANAEFEVLCGFPVTENAVFFEGWLRRPVPCLPDVLRRAGYRTVASHPNVPGFWNRTLAYRLTGFDEYLSKASFDTTDSVGNFLLDHSYFDQLFEQLGPLDATPLLNYALTYHGHLPYPNGPGYPDRVEPGPGRPDANGRAPDTTLLKGYLNHVWYKSRDLMERLDKLRAADPKALIVVFGDHLPFLNPNYGVYDEVFALPAKRDDFTGEQLERLVSTPLIVIDGARGPLTLPPTPLYRLPSLILELLGADSGGMFDWTANPPGTTIRPVYGQHVAIGDEASLACPPEKDNPACAESAAWLARTRLLIDDVFSGEQHALELVRGRRSPG